MKSAWLVFWSCVVLLVVGTASQFVPFPGPCDLTLVRDAVANHRIATSDVKPDDKVERCLSWFAEAPSDFAGRYLAKDHRAGDKVTLRDSATGSRSRRARRSNIRRPASTR